MANELKAQDYPIAQKLDVGTNAFEDRVVMIAGTKGHGRRCVLLTRRMMKNLLAKYVGVLEQTGQRASKAARRHKSEVLQMEHIAAVSQEIDQEGRSTDTSEHEQDRQLVGRPDTIYLAVGFHFEPRDGHILLAFNGVKRNPFGPDGEMKEPALGFAMDRTTACKALAMLHDKADEAGWDLEKPSNWTAKLQQARSESLN